MYHFPEACTQLAKFLESDFMMGTQASVLFSSLLQHLAILPISNNICLAKLLFKDPNLLL